MKEIVMGLLLFGASIFVYSQKGDIRGLVLDESNEPLPGAIVTVKPGPVTTMSTTGGNFIFRQMDYGLYQMEVKYIGYANYYASIELNDSVAGISVRMLSRLELLDEVVIRGTNSHNRKLVNTLNVEVVNEEYLARNRQGSFMKTLERLPGVSTIDIGSGHSKPVIRGLSFNRLLVIDNGIKHQAQQWGADHGLEIDQFAVEEVEIVKGPSSLQFGSDAIGGAIIISGHQVPGINTSGGEVDVGFQSNNASYAGSLQWYARANRAWFSLRVTNIDYADFRIPAGYVDVYSYKVKLKDNRLSPQACYRSVIGHLFDHWAGQEVSLVMDRDHAGGASQDGVIPVPYF